MSKRYKNCERLLDNGFTKTELGKMIKTFCSRKKEYWTERGYSFEEAGVMARSKMPGTFEYFHLFKGFSESESQKKVLEFQNKRKNTLENFVSKYGQEEGKNRFNSYCNKQAYSNTLEYMIKKYGIQSGTEKYYTANRKRAITLDNLIDKHGDKEGLKIYERYVAKQRINGKTLEYFIQKYGPEDGQSIYDNLSRRKSRSYDGFLLQYNGDVEKATEEYEKYWNKIYISSISKRGVSKCSQDFFRLIHGELAKLGITGVYYDSFNQEWAINIVGKRFVYLDFFIKSKGKVIEYYGDYYHATPSKYSDSDTIKIFGESKLAKEIWLEDKLRIDDIRSVPYIKDVMIVWQGDVTNNESEELKKCIQFILT